MINFQKYSNLKYLQRINIDFDSTTDDIIISLSFSGKKEVSKHFTKDCLITQHDEIDEFITDEIEKYLHLREKKLKRIIE